MVTGWYELIGRSSISCHTQIYTYTNIRINLYGDLYGDSARHYILTIDELNSVPYIQEGLKFVISILGIEKVWSHTKLSVQPEKIFSPLINTYSFKSFYTCPPTQMVVKTLSLLWTNSSQLVPYSRSEYWTIQKEVVLRSPWVNLWQNPSSEKRNTWTTSINWTTPTDYYCYQITTLMGSHSCLSGQTETVFLYAFDPNCKHNYIRHMIQSPPSPPSFSSPSSITTN